MVDTGDDGEPSASAQPEAAAAGQEGEVEYVAGVRTQRIHVCVVAAKNVVLDQAVRGGQFRKDLLYRRSEHPARIPAQRDRASDIPGRVQTYVDADAAKHAKRIVGIKNRAVEALKSHTWPGNICELQNTIECEVIFADDAGFIERHHVAIGGIDRDVLRQAAAADPVPTPVEPQVRGHGGLLEVMFVQHTTMEDLQDHQRLSAIEKAGENLSDAAKFLGISRSQVPCSLKEKAAITLSAPRRGKGVLPALQFSTSNGRSWPSSGGWFSSIDGIGREAPKMNA